MAECAGGIVVIREQGTNRSSLVIIGCLILIWMGFGVMGQLSIVIPLMME